MDPRLGRLQAHCAAGARGQQRYPDRRGRLFRAAARVGDAAGREARRLDDRGAVDDDRPEAVLQRFRGAQGIRPTASTAASWPASTSRRMSVPGRGTATARGSSCCWPTETCSSS